MSLSMNLARGGSLYPNQGLIHTLEGRLSHLLTAARNLWFYPSTGSAQHAKEHLRD
jgi:hypothetical protein